jgi:hypothetical protein
MINNSTIYSRVVPGGSSYFARWNNPDVAKVFGSYEGGYFRIMNSTICRMMAKKDFANNIPKNSAYEYGLENCVFYDVYRLQKLKYGATNTTKKETNTTWGVSKSVDGTDKKEFATEENPGFTDENLNAILDFSQPNGGVNFKATGTLSSTIGDPRWL